MYYSVNNRVTNFSFLIFTTSFLWDLIFPIFFSITKIAKIKSHELSYNKTYNICEAGQLGRQSKLASCIIRPYKDYSYGGKLLGKQNYSPHGVIPVDIKIEICSTLIVWTLCSRYFLTQITFSNSPSICCKRAGFSLSKNILKLAPVYM